MENDFDIDDFEDINDIERLEIEDILQYVSEFIEKGNKSIIQFVRTLVRSGCLE